MPSRSYKSGDPVPREISRNSPASEVITPEKKEFKEGAFGTPPPVQDRYSAHAFIVNEACRGLTGHLGNLLPDKHRTPPKWSREKAVLVSS